MRGAQEPDPHFCAAAAPPNRPPPSAGRNRPLLPCIRSAIKTGSARHGSRVTSRQGDRARSCAIVRDLEGRGATGRRAHPPTPPLGRPGVHKLATLPAHPAPCVLLHPADADARAAELRTVGCALLFDAARPACAASLRSDSPGRACRTCRSTAGGVSVARQACGRCEMCPGPPRADRVAGSAGAEAETEDAGRHGCPQIRHGPGAWPPRCPQIRDGPGARARKPWECLAARPGVPATCLTCRAPHPPGGVTTYACPSRTIRHAPPITALVTNYAGRRYRPRRPLALRPKANLPPRMNV